MKLLQKLKPNDKSEANSEGEANPNELPKEWRFHQNHPQENPLTESSEKLLQEEGLGR